LLRAIVAIGPGFHRRRYRRGVQERGVVLHLDRNGTAVLSGEGLPPDEAAAAAARLDRLAEAAKRAGHPGRLTQIAADLFLGMLDGRFYGLTEAQILAYLLAHPRPEDADDSPDADRDADADADADQGAERDADFDLGADAERADETRDVENCREDGADDPAPADSPDEDGSDADPASEESASEESDSEESAGGELSAADPAEDCSVDEDWADEVAAEEVAAEEVPADQDPANEDAAEESVAEEDPVDASPVDESPVGESPAGESPAGESPAGEASADRASGRPAEPQRDPEPDADHDDQAGRGITPAAFGPPGDAPSPTGPEPGGVGDRWCGERVGIREGVEIRVGLGTLLGCDERPGEIPGLGPVDAEIARRTAAAQHRGAEWVHALVDGDGYLLLAGPLRRRPHYGGPPGGNSPAAGPPGAGPPGRVRGGVVEIHLTVAELHRLAAEPAVVGGWGGVLAEIADRWAERHRLREQLARDPWARFARGALARHVQVRDRTCIGPGVRREALVDRVEVKDLDR
jgi:hypothetical protein